MSLTRDLKIAIRHLLKSPGFAATAILIRAWNRRYNSHLLYR